MFFLGQVIAQHFPYLTVLCYLSQDFFLPIPNLLIAVLRHFLQLAEQVKHGRKHNLKYLPDCSDLKHFWRFKNPFFFIPFR